MTTRSIGSALFIAATLAAGTASATVTTLESCGTTWGGAIVGTAVVSRAASNNIKVSGFGVDFATRVETTIPGATVTIKERHGGSDSYVVINVAIPKGDKLLGARVSLRYAVEISGPDTFLVDVYPVPKVDSLAFQSGPRVSTVNGVPTLTTGDPHILVLKGQYLDALRPMERVFTSAGLKNPSVVLLQAGEMHLSFTPAIAKSYSIGRTLFTVDPGYCNAQPDDFTIAFTGVDRPRTPTPTPTATATRTPTPLPFSPIRITPGIRSSFPPTPTPTPANRKGGP